MEDKGKGSRNEGIIGIMTDEITPRTRMICS
jgi:hypothetical protein